MNKKMYDLLMKIKEDPYKYLGEKTLSALEFFLRGYRDCIDQNEDININKFKKYFEDFVRMEYNIFDYYQRPYRVMRLHCKTEEEAFDKFFELLGKFFEEYDFETFMEDNEDDVYKFIEQNEKYEKETKNKYYKKLIKEIEKMSEMKEKSEEDAIEYLGNNFFIKRVLNI